MIDHNCTQTSRIVFLEMPILRHLCRASYKEEKEDEQTGVISVAGSRNGIDRIAVEFWLEEGVPILNPLLIFASSGRMGTHLSQISSVLLEGIIT